MKIARRKMGTVEVLTPDGPLTGETGEVFLEAVRTQLQTAQPRIVVSMEDVAYVDSSGLEILLDILDEVQGKSLSLKLANLTPTCREIIYLTDLIGEFDLFDDAEDAVRSFS